MKYKIAIDIGGYNIKTALVRDGKIIKKFDRLTEVSKGKQKIIKNILESIDLVKGGYKIKGIGIGCPGPADYKTGKIINSPNLKPLWGVNLKKIIQKKFKVKVGMENDANCAALAELKYRKDRNFVVLTLGTGVGCGIIVDRKLYKGNGKASELGHMVIDNGKELEDLASGAAILNKARKRFGKKLLARDLIKLAKGGNKTAKKIIEESAEYLGIGLGNIANIFDPNIIILTGGLKDAGNYYLNIAKKKMRKVALLKCDVIWSKLEKPGLVGASYLV